MLTAHSSNFLLVLLQRMSSVKCDLAVLFGLIFSLIVLLDSVVIIASAQGCSVRSQMGYSICNDFVEIKYPFWYIEDGYSDLEYCGYPGLEIKCTEDLTITVMNISNQLYSVSTMDYQNKFVIVKELDIDRPECPHQRRNISSLQEFGSSLYYSSEYYIWALFYNCSRPPPRYDKIVEKFHLSCLDNSGQRSYAFPYYEEVPKGFNWYENCEESLVVPNNYYIFNNSESNYTIAAKSGFALEWEAPNDDCRNCESSGGLCTFYNNHTNGGFRNCACGSDILSYREFDKTCPRKKGI